MFQGKSRTYTESQNGTGKDIANGVGRIMWKELYDTHDGVRGNSKPQCSKVIYSPISGAIRFPEHPREAILMT